jgi:hypothetical protein|tara:strand:- start:357 stop:491 length:135 start_codon:yes stop_codon:yes gene_type:complete
LIEVEDHEQSLTAEVVVDHRCRRHVGEGVGAQGFADANAGDARR